DVDAEFGEFGVQRVLLFRYYNIALTPGGRFKVSPHSDYARDWALATMRRPRRAEERSPSVFSKVLFTVEVRTVEHDRSHHRLDPVNQYSVVDRLLDRRAGAPPA